MVKLKEVFSWLPATALGSAIFAAGFSLFLIKAAMNGGGVTGLSMVIHQLTGWASVGTIAIGLNLPLFVLAGVKVGRRFFLGSILGMVVSSLLIDAFAFLPMPPVEPLLACLYGGSICGLGLGIVFAAGTSTGGTDILARLLKLRCPNVPMGTITIALDVCVALLTGLVFRDVTKALYSGITVFVSGQVMDVVIYRFDYSKVALIISDEYDAIAKAVGEKLNRGATFLNGEGSYTHAPKQVVLTVVKRRQLAELKELVIAIDPNAFIIVQEAHQVLGDGFSRYSKHAL